MPLVERFTDWTVPASGTYDDPRRLDFDHRMEADVNSAEVVKWKAEPENVNAKIDRLVIP